MYVPCTSRKTTVGSVELSTGYNGKCGLRSELSKLSETQRARFGVTNTQSYKCDVEVGEHLASG